MKGKELLKIFERELKKLNWTLWATDKKRIFSVSAQVGRVSVKFRVRHNRASLSIWFVSASGEPGDVIFEMVPYPRELQNENEIMEHLDYLCRFEIGDELASVATKALKLRELTTRSRY